MTTGSTHLEYRRLRAPQEDGAALVEPPFSEVGALLRANLADRTERCYDLQGRCLSKIAQDARRELIAQARRWTTQYRDVDLPPLDDSAPIFLAGHQPQLFHPGVWFKNFALGTLARRHGALAVNLVIDSDTLKTTSLPVPGGIVDAPDRKGVPLDRTGPTVPYEERLILDRPTFADFGRRAAERIRPLVPDPLLSDYWPMAVARARETENLGAALAQSRHQLEGYWGLSTLEIPQSRVCAMRPHGWFVAHLLARLPEFWAVYNAAVEEYRRANRIRSSAHPVPNLARHDEWIEAPFWIWTVDDPRRRPLFVRQRGGHTLLSDRQSLELALPLSPDGEAGRAVQRLQELGQRGIKIRCRALITTLWARLALGDLFVHGIGGAKYDQVTDALISRFFKLKPPEILVLSASLHLPIPRKRTTVDDLRRIEHRLRELTYHPETFVDGPAGTSGPNPAPAEWIEAKTRWIRTPQTPENARTRFRQIRRINEALQPYVAPLRERLLHQRSQALRALRAEAVLSWREYAFCLFPEKTLRDFLLRLLHKTE